MPNQPAHHGLERTLSNSSASTVRHSAYSSPRDSQWSEDASRENTGYARASEPRRYYNGPQQMAQSQARTAIPQPLQRNSLTSNNQGNPYSDRPQRAMSPAPGQSGRDDVPWGGPFPSLHLWPMNETFPTKMIHLPPCLSRVGGERVKIGRQTNVKSVPSERNGFFDSKVLSRMHAEVWSEIGSDGEGRMYIRDVKSSNGTFVNGERLSQEGVESEPYELKSEDTVEFGIDIVSEDNRTVVHYKVSCKAYCVWNVDDAGLSARELVHYYAYDQQRSIGPTRKGNGAAPPGNGAPSVAMMSAGGKGIGLNFDHVLAKLQMELEKSKETGAELQTLTSAMTDIQETLNGGLPPNENGQAEKQIPPQFRPAENEPVYVPGLPDHVIGDPTATIAALQAQLSSTQSILVSHKDRIRSLETLLREHETIKDEVLGLRQQMEQSKQDFELMLQSQTARRGSHSDGSDNSDEEGEKSGKPDRKGGDNGSSSSQHSSSLQRSTSNMSLSSSPNKTKISNEEVMNQTNTLYARLDTLSEDLEQALEISRTLQKQHAESLSAVKLLEDKVVSLERDMAMRVADAAEHAGRAAEDRWESWKNKFEEGWRKEREGWEQERERLRRVVREWEEASRRAQEEEEERLMNGRLSGDSEPDDGSSSSDDGSRRRRSRADDWIVPNINNSSDPESLLMRMPARSHSASPRSSFVERDDGVRIRRESSSRLDPAIRALKAAAGEPSGERGIPRTTGGSTPRTGSPSAAEGALGALRARSARNRRAATITARKRGQQRRKSSGTEKEVVGKSGLSVSDSVKTITETENADEDTRNISQSDSTESDETAHEGPKSDSEREKSKTQVIKPETKQADNDMGKLGQHIPFAVSIVIVGVAAWAYVHRIKD